MIRQTALILLFIVSFCFNEDLGAKNDFRTNTSIPKSTIDTIMKYALTYPNETQFSIAIIKDDSVHFIGVKKRDGDLISIDNKDSVFEIGSITKVFTSTVFVNLILSGKLNPDEPISQSLPFKLSESEKDEKIISYKMLSQTAKCP